MLKYILFLLILLLSCQGIRRDMENTAQHKAEITVVKADSDGCELVLENDTDKDLMYGEKFIVQKYLNGQWVDCEMVESEQIYVWSDIGLLLPAGESREEKCDWSYMYGSFADGTYRILKDIDDPSNRIVQTLFAEFELTYP